MAADDPRTAAALIDELRAVAAAFTEDEADAARVLQTMAEDVARAMAHPLDIFPVIHHSPASAVQMVRYLRTRQPKLVLVEMCEDLLGMVEHLRDCVLPVALQALASQPVGFPPSWAPLSVVSPLTELSAEYQAIAYALRTDGVQLRFVDRSVDHVYQWIDPEEDPDAPVHDDFDEEDEDAIKLHGGALGIQLGEITPTFADFREFLLQNARMTHFSEWVSLYVEQPAIACDTVSYREILCMIGSLFRRLGTTAHDRETIRSRDRYMWTRIKQALAETGIAPADAVFICGAAHIVDDDVPEWGLESDARWEEIAPRSGTTWQYGFIPSSYGAIELQFGQPRGAVSMAESEWKKAIKRSQLTPFTLDPPQASKKKPAKKKSRASQPAAPEQLSFRSLLRDAPALTATDQVELIEWCTGIVASARKHRYMASTADAIAIYETSILLARIRARNRPSPYDFVDAAETCLEKSRPPGRRNVRQLCHRMLGGDRIGQVGYSSLPPLVQDVYDRLAILGVSSTMRTVKRVLMDFGSKPELRPASQLLWRLHWLLAGTRVARPIMGELALGVESRQESWDVRISGPEQRAVIELSFRGVTVEQVLERQLQDQAFDEDATTLDALRAAEACALLLERTRLFSRLGERAVVLLAGEEGPDDAEAIFDTVRRLVHHFRGTTEGLPSWLQSLVAVGYAHYSTLLPTAFADRGTSPQQLAAMLSFVFTLESLALTMGCERSQLLIAIEQSGRATADPEKRGLLWACEWLVQQREASSLREAFEAVLEHPLGRSTYPAYLSGFLRCVQFSPRAVPLATELLGRAFVALPDDVLLPWIPGLLTTLQPLANEIMPAMFKELRRGLPRAYAGIDGWDAPWFREAGEGVASALPTAEATPAPAPVEVSERARVVRGLLMRFRAAPSAWAEAHGLDGTAWGEETPSERACEVVEAGDGGEPLQLLARWPASGEAWRRVIDGAG